MAGGTEEILESSNGQSPYTRADFLRFDAASRGSNADILGAIAAGKEDVETAEAWKDFGSWVDYPTLLTPEVGGLELLAYTIFHFSPCVVSKNRLPLEEKLGDVPLRQWLSIDDIAFLLVTLENCINKWIRSYRFLVKKRDALKRGGKWCEGTRLVDIKLTKPRKRLAGEEQDYSSELSQMKNLPGTKFQTGSGVSGPKGQRRFDSLKLYILKNYYADTDTARENEKALNGALKKAVAAENWKSNVKKKKQPTVTRVQRPVGDMDKLRSFEWELLFPAGSAFSACEAEGSQFAQL